MGQWAEDAQRGKWTERPLDGFQPRAVLRDFFWMVQPQNDVVLGADQLFFVVDHAGNLGRSKWALEITLGC